MKLILKIAVLTAFIAFAGSCQKEKLPTPHSCTSPQQITANQRSSNSSSSDTSNVIHKGDEGRGSGEIVGGGDDDKDGGRKAKPSHEK